MDQGSNDLETTLSAVSLIDHDGVDWKRVQRTAYLIHQHLHYEYPGPIHDLKQHLMIIPPDLYGDQRRIVHRLEVSERVFELTSRQDAFGNTEVNLYVPYVEHTIDFEAWIVAERLAGQGPHLISAALLTDPLYLQPSTLTQPDAGLQEAAALFLTGGKQGRELAEQINDWVYQHMDYAHDVTTIHTTAAEILTLKQGVCQDYAHLMLALCRLCALPARYVSGHLLGEGGTHAWVEVLLPVDGQPDQAYAVPFDPTHGRQTSFSYVTIAVGRDYFDVAPTSGTFRATYRGELSARKHVGLTLLEYADT